MSNLDHNKLQEIATELAKTVKTQEDLSNLSSMLVKMTVEAALGAEMEEHLGYSKIKSLTQRIAVTALLSLLLLKKGKPVSHTWMIKYSFFMPKG